MVATMAGKIFIDYRRAVNLKDAQLLQNVLHRHFGRAAVFLDVSGLEGGDHWLHTLERQVDESVAMVSLLGKGWADLKDEKGNRRLDNPNDFVRFEMARAFARDIPVLPVLIDGASMPELSQLPSNLVPLTFPQAMLLRAESLDDDAEKIARRLKQLVAAARRPGISPWIAGGVAVAALAVGVGLAPFLFTAAGLTLPWARELANVDLQRQLDEADRGRRAAEAKVLVALQAKAAAEREAQGQATQVSRLDGLLVSEKEKVKTAQGKIEALEAQVEAQKRAVEQTRSQADLLRQLIDAKDRELVALKKGVPDRKLGEVASTVDADPKLMALPRQVPRCIEVPVANETRCLHPGSGKTEWFKDCASCPEMVAIPDGTFTMGSPEAELDRESWQKGTESPEHKVSIKQPFAVGRFAVTFDEWDACVAAGGCNGYQPGDQSWGRGRRPVINVSWNDARAYTSWISKVTGKHYRLLSEAEREYATRAGTVTPFWWGSSISPTQANYDGRGTYGGGPRGEYLQKTVSVESFAANPWGLYQVHGNVYEWVEDCWNPNYENAPSDGRAWLTGDCNSRVLRGGSRSVIPRNLRAANRSYSPTYHRTTKYGFRVARTFNP